MSEVLQLKTGSNSELLLKYYRPTGDEDEDGNCILEPHPLVEYEIRIEYLSPKTGLPLASLDMDNGIVILDEAEGLYSANPGDTKDWPLGKLAMDVLYIYRGTEQATETFFLDMVRGYTQ